MDHKYSNSSEVQIYEGILALYEKTMGIDLRSDPLLYHKVREIIDLMKGQHQNDEERLRRNSHECHYL